MKAPGPNASHEPAIMQKTVGQALNDAVAQAGQRPSPGPSLVKTAVENLDTLLGREESDGNWPKTVQEFEDGGYLQPGDIVLMTKLGSLFSRLMELFDRSDFAHCALVYQTPQHEAGLDDVYLIETSFSGVDIQTFSEVVAPRKVYKDIKLPPDYVVGIRRLETDWVTPSLRRITSSRMLHFIDNDDYDFSMLLALATRRTTNAYFRWANRLLGKAPTVSQYLGSSKVKFSPAEFICSGFVQFAYVDMVRLAIERGLISHHIAHTAWHDVLFSSAINGETSMRQLMAVKPRELASTPKLKWKYLINQGKVYKIDSHDDVNALFNEIKARHRKLMPQP